LRDNFFGTSVATYWCEVTGGRAWVFSGTRTHEHKFKEERSCFDTYSIFIHIHTHTHTHTHIHTCIHIHVYTYTYIFLGHLLLAGKSPKFPNRCCSEMEVARILVKRIHVRVENCVGHETTLTFLHLCWVCLSPKGLVSYDLTFHPSKIMK
jgi:hypothetical protein